MSEVCVFELDLNKAFQIKSSFLGAITVQGGVGTLNSTGSALL